MYGKFHVGEFKYRLNLWRNAFFKSNFWLRLSRDANPPTTIFAPNIIQQSCSFFLDIVAHSFQSRGLTAGNLSGGSIQKIWGGGKMAVVAGEGILQQSFYCCCLDGRRWLSDVLFGSSYMVSFNTSDIKLFLCSEQHHDWDGDDIEN